MTESNTPPNEIYLQWHWDVDTGGLIGDFHPESMDISWREHKVLDGDVKYVRAELVDDANSGQVDHLKSVLFSILAIVRDPKNRGSMTLHQQCKLMDHINDMVEEVLSK